MPKTQMDAASISGSPKALLKGIALVDLVAEQHATGVRQAELVERSGLPRATALRLLDALVENAVLRVEEGPLYRLGPRLARWGGLVLGDLDVARVSADVVASLVVLTRETCFIGVRDGDSVLYVAAVNSPQAVRPAAHVGWTNPLYSTGIGKALLAYEDEADIDATLSRLTFEPRTAHTVANRDELSERLAQVRELGYSIDDIENEEGVRCVAAPIFDHRGKIAAAISVSAPAYRFSRDDVERWSTTVIEAARSISERLGHRVETTSEGIAS